MTYRGHIKNGVAVLDTPANLPDGTPVRVEVDRADGEFWRDRSIEELAREQGVTRIADLKELAGAWPEDESIDEFLSLVREVRR